MQAYNFQPFQSSHSRWRAVTQRDPAAHCSFLYGVTSTKIYCRPTCSARVARRANVVFYDTNDQARQDGFRPCHRCMPDDTTFIGQREEVVLRALALLRTKKDGATMKGAVKELAKGVGVTPSYLCRVFKKTMGLTLGEYIRQFETLGSEGETASSIQSPSTIGPGAVGVGMGPSMSVAPAWSPPETESVVQSPSIVGSGMADLRMGQSTPVTTASSPLALVGGWPAPSADAPYQPMTGVEEPLDWNFDYDEWLWTEGFDFNDWVTTVNFPADGMYG